VDDLFVVGQNLNKINFGAHFAQSYGLFDMINNENNTKISDMSFMDAVILMICIAWALEPLLERPPTVTNAVYHGYSSWMEPTLFLRGRFIFNARSLIASGSVKVSLFSTLCNAGHNTKAVERSTVRSTTLGS
jgi:hypothetical protein